MAAGNNKTEVISPQAIIDELASKDNQQLIVDEGTGLPLFD